MHIAQGGGALGLLVAALLQSACAQPVVARGVLLTQTGHSLYVFDNDVVGSGASACHAPCSNIFPPYLADDKDAAAGAFSFVLRNDRSRQWAHKGRPLYRFYADEKPGDVGGDGMNRNLWHVARR